jgi:hypothetical protein
MPVRSGKMFVDNHRTGEEDTSDGDRRKAWKHNHLHSLFDVSVDLECQLPKMPRSSSVIAMQLIFYPAKPLSVVFVFASSALSPTIGRISIVLGMRGSYTPHDRVHTSCCALILFDQAPKSLSRSSCSRTASSSFNLFSSIL